MENHLRSRRAGARTGSTRPSWSCSPMSAPLAGRFAVSAGRVTGTAEFKVAASSSSSAPAVRSSRRRSAGTTVQTTWELPGSSAAAAECQCHRLPSTTPRRSRGGCRPRTREHVAVAQGVGAALTRLRQERARRAHHCQSCGLKKTGRSIKCTWRTFCRTSDRFRIR